MRAIIDYGSISGGGIDVSDTTALVEDVLEGKVFHLANGESAVGTRKDTNAYFGSLPSIPADTVTQIDVGFEPSSVILLRNVTQYHEYVAYYKDSGYAHKIEYDSSTQKWTNLGSDRMIITINSNGFAFKDAYLQGEETKFFCTQ